MTERRRNLLILGLVAALLAASLVAITTRDTKQGLDLRGGVELIYQAKPTPQQPEITQEAIDRSLEILRKRVDQLGVAEPEIQRQGPDQISVGLPDVTDAERAQEQVGTTAQLFFYDWEPNVLGENGRPAPEDPTVHGGPAAGSQGAVTLHEAVTRASETAEEQRCEGSTPDQYYLFDSDQAMLAGPEESREALREAVENGPVPEDAETLVVPQGTTVVQAERPPNLPEDAPFDRWYALQDCPALTGTDVRNPEQNFDSGPGGTGQPIVTMEFTGEGREKFQDVTRQIAQRGQEAALPGTPPDAARQHFAIVLDDELVSVPFIDFQQNPDGIDGSTGAQISGGFDIQSAQDLANFLRIGALPVRLDLISQSQVSATLGQQALDQGLIAGAAGLAVVILFLLTFYRVLGLVASMALGIYGVYLFALIKLIPVTLTLPGIAGLILTLGVAADANIVIFERVKEEVRAGRAIPAAISAGYKKGLTAILDANVVTLMVAFILFILATAGVKGFALVLGLGVIVSLFTAVVATSAILGVLARSRLMAGPQALGAGTQRMKWRYDYMGASKWFFAGSGVILVIGALGIGGKGLNFGIDFESGTRIKTALEQPATEGQVRSVMSEVGYPEAKIQQVEDPELGETVFQVSTAELQPPRVQEVRNALDEEFGVGEGFSNQSVGPTFGQTVANQAILALIVSLLVISAYIALRFEWKFAVPVLIALSHDILLTSGVYALVGREVTTSTVAALLTLLGYSLYDTIIVFDRIRENIPRMPRAAFTQIVNRSMSEVVTRSLATSFSTALPVVALLTFGGETLQDFAFALLVGTISGTYSSIFIAGPVLSAWKEREPVYVNRRARIAQENGGVVPAYAEGSYATEREPAERRSSRRRLTEPVAPGEQVSKDEFDEMVRDLHTDEPPAPRPGFGASSSSSTGARAAGSPPRRKPGDGEATGGDGADAPGGEPKRSKPKKPRNRRHGRAR
jgi:SecD/SecF fusion protein